MMKNHHRATKPAGEEGSARAWRAIHEQVTDGLLDLIAERPDVSDRVGPLMKLLIRLRDQLEDEDRRLLFHVLRTGPHSTPPDVLARVRAAEPGALETHASTRQALLRFAESREPAIPKQYFVEDHNLKELTASPHGETVLQVGYDDYMRVAAALQRLAGRFDLRRGGRAGVSARRIMADTGRADASKDIGRRQVSLTHVYICLRFWQREEIIDRPVRGQFRPADLDRDFSAVASDSWERLAACTLPRG